MRKNKRIGLSLSGGGYRAAAFHIGTLKKLNQMNILKDVDIISSNSGGSITATYYSLMMEKYKNANKAIEETETNLKKLLRKSVIRRLIFSLRIGLPLLFTLCILVGIFCLNFIKLPFLSISILFGFIIVLGFFHYVIFPFSSQIAKIYERLFFKGKKIKDLPASPSLVINSTNLESGLLWIFSRNKMGDSTYSQSGINFIHSDFSLSKAVAASTCVPFAFSPVKISKKYFFNQDDFKKINPRLIDGGIYDNQGIHKITHSGSSYECDIIIASDAGGRFEFKSNQKNIITLLNRVSALFMKRIKNLQIKLNVYLNKNIKQREIAYFSLGWDAEECVDGFVDHLLEGNIIPDVIKAHNIPQELINNKNKSNIIQYIESKINFIDIKFPDKDKVLIAKNVKTNLTALSKLKIDSLIEQAEALTEIQIKLYCPGIVIDENKN